MACYDGQYPVEYDASVDKHIMERRRERSESQWRMIRNRNCLMAARKNRRAPTPPPA